jgi:hypothetical protein
MRSLTVPRSSEAPAQEAVRLLAAVNVGMITATMMAD